MDNHNIIMELDRDYPEYAIGSTEAESKSWINPSFSLASHLPEFGTCAESYSFLPELPLQPTISAEVELLCDYNQEESSFRNKEVEEVEQEAESEGREKEHSCSRDEHSYKLRRTRSSEVHNRSEKRRRNRIQGQVKALQELMPHCKKKDRASILEDATEYIKALNNQIEMFIKVRRADCLVPCMPHAGNMSMHYPSQSLFMPVRPCIGTGIGMPFGVGMCGITYNATCVPMNQISSAAPPFLSPRVTAYPFPVMCATVEPTVSGNFSGVQHCPDTFKAPETSSRGNCDQSYVQFRAEESCAVVPSLQQSLESGGTLRKMEAGSSK